MTSTTTETTDRRAPVARRLAIAAVAGAAAVPTALSAHGMYGVATTVLGFLPVVAVALAGFLELALLASALLATLRAKEGLPGGLDVVAIWAFSGITGTFSAWKELAPADGGPTLVATPSTLLAATVRLVAPLVAAWLLERLMTLFRHEVAGRSWADILRNRRYLAVARAALAVRRAEEAEDTTRALRARRRLDRAHVRALRAVPPSDSLPGMLAAVAAVDHLPAATVLTPAAVDRETGTRPARRASSAKRAPAAPVTEHGAGVARDVRVRPASEATPAAPARRSKLTSEQEAQIAQLAAEGASQRDIATAVGTSRASVVRCLERLDSTGQADRPALHAV